MLRVFVPLGLILILGSFQSRAESGGQQHDNTLRGQINLLDQEGNTKKWRTGIAVFIDQVPEVSEAPKEHHTISQRGRRFRPGTLPVMKGSTVDFFNDDKVLHNVFSLSKNRPFDLGNYEHGTSRAVTFDNPGLVKVYCNLHSKMVLNVLVLNNSHFTTTNPDGEFELANLPDGTYTLRIWHEFSDEKRIEVSLSANQIKTLNIDLQETRSFIQHNNKYGKPYRGKY